MAGVNPLRSLLGGTQPDRIPFWFCGHLGLWHRGFREWKAEKGWPSLYGDVEHATKLSLETADAWGLDGVTLWTHPLAPLALLGYEPVADSEGVPALSEILYSPAQIQSTRVQTPNDLVEDAMLAAMRSQESGRPLVVRLWGPLTLLGHLIEGRADWQPRLRALLFQYPSQARVLLQQVTHAMVGWSKRLAEAGADIFYVDEVWASMFGPEDQSIFSLPWLLEYVENMKPVPVMVRAPGMDALVSRFHKADAAAYMPEMHTPPETLRQASAWSLPLLGPLDPGRLLSPIPVFHQYVGRFIEVYGKADLVMSLASAPLPHTSGEQIAQFARAVAEFRS